MKAKTALIQLMMLAVARFCTGNIILTTTFIKLRPLGYLQCASMCLEYSDCEEIFYSKTKLDCRLNYLNSGIINYLPKYFETFMSVSRSTIKQLIDSINNNSATANDCPERKRRIMLKSGAIVCVGFLPAYTGLINAALNKPTNQSSTYPSASRSNKAVDGNWAMDINKCTGTLYQGGNWWTVDLVQLYYIYEIHIQNRGDCCGKRLTDFSVQVDVKTDDMSVVAYFDGFALLKQLIKFSFKFPLVGRNVRIQRHSMGYLAMCEVAVHAHIA